MKVVLDGKLYRLGAVRETAEAFAELAEISVGSAKGKIEVSLEQIDPEVEDELVDEFLNYALAVTISSRS